MNAIRLLGILGFVFFSANIGHSQSFDFGRPAVSPRFATLGNDGELLDRYTEEVTSSSPSSSTFTMVLRPAIVARCADADGCTLRLSYIDMESGDRETEPPSGFTIDPQGQEWTIRDRHFAQVRGTNGDDGQDIIHAVAGGRCYFSDDHDFIIINNMFRLTADPAPGEEQSFRCSLAIDD